MNLRKSLKKRRGFTLLEIIIVIIIIGVLAALVLPGLFGVVAKSYSTECLTSVASARSSEERYKIQYGTYTNNFSLLDMVNPNQPGSHFDYTFTGALTSGRYAIVCTRNSLDGSNAGDTITVTVDSATGITKVGTGAFSNI